MVIRSYSASPRSTAATSAKNSIGANKANSTAETPSSHLRQRRSNAAIEARAPVRGSPGPVRPVSGATRMSAPPEPAEAATPLVLRLHVSGDCMGDSGERLGRIGLRRDIRDHPALVRGPAEQQ